MQASEIAAYGDENDLRRKQLHHTHGSGCPVGCCCEMSAARPGGTARS